MSANLNLRQLDTCLPNRATVSQLRAVLEKIDKICQALDKGMNLADILDGANLDSFRRAFGDEHFEQGLQLIYRLGLADYQSKSFIVNKTIEGPKKFDFFYRSVGAWKQFNTVILLQFPENTDFRKLMLVNSSKGEHWKTIQAIPEGTLVTVALRTVGATRSQAQEKLALERYLGIFEMVQTRADSLEKVAPEPVLQFTTPPAAKTNGATPAAKPKTAGAKTNNVRPLRASSVPSFKSMMNAQAATKSTTPSFAFKVVINKMDTFVHAGNAQLICTHIRAFQGRVEMFVLRAEKKVVRLDVDSIWSAEIRNGETVLFEFFGPQPDEGFVKELAKKVNKYTQMDKLGHD